MVESVEDKEQKKKQQQKLQDDLAATESILKLIKNMKGEQHRKNDQIRELATKLLANKS